MGTIELIVEQTNTGYSAYAKDYLACTTGDDMTELKNNIIEVMNFYFEEMETPKRIVTENDLKLEFA